jgi:hypothetical protein
MDLRALSILPLIFAVASSTARKPADTVSNPPSSKPSNQPQPDAAVVTRELRVVDASGKTRLLLSAVSGQPLFQLLLADGTPAITAALDDAGHGSIKLQNPDRQAPVASLEIDDKGSHVKLDRPGGASTYLFLNNAGASGLVLIDAKGKRRFAAIVGADGTVSLQQPDEKGKPTSPLSQ